MPRCPGINKCGLMALAALALRMNGLSYGEDVVNIWLPVLAPDQAMNKCP